MSPLAQTLVLSAHPGTRTGAVRSLRVAISRHSKDRLALTYILEGALDGLRIPEKREPRMADKLWEHTCFEVFVAAGDAGYHEFNISPSGEWAVYRFARYRERTPLSAELELRLQPQTALRLSPERLELDALIRLDLLPSTPATVKLAISAVLEETTGRLTYWALKHPDGKPDFHHPTAFALELDEIRN